MKKTKRIVSLITAAAFLLSSVAPGFAKSIDDASNRLISLDLVKGYEDGSIRPDQNITRAEYAVVMVRALGLETAATISTGGATKFKDVAASSWASGYVNVAVSQGVIRGYPDGTFKPDAKVSNAEAITMVVRLLGYEDTLTKINYPTSYITKAAELKILDDATINDFTALATRGNVFMLADNALDTAMWGLKETNSKGEKVYGELNTLIKEKQKITENDAALITNAGAGISGVPKDVATVGGVDYKWGLTKSTTDFVGVKAKIYWKLSGTDKKIVAVNPVGAVKTGKVESYTVTSDGNISNDKVKLFGIGEYTANSGARTVTSGAYGTLTETTALKGKYVTLSLSDSGKIESVVFKDYTDADIVKAVNTTDKKIEFKKISSLDLKNIDDKNLEVIKDSKIATLADIKAGDVVSYYKNGDYYTIYTSNQTVTGKLDSSSTTGVNSLKFVIAGKSYYSTEAGVYTSTDAGETVSASKTTSVTTIGTDLVTKNVTAKLDAQGNVVAVFAGGTSATDTNSFDAFVRQIYTDTASGNTVAKILVTKLDGTAASYEIDKDSYTYSAFNSDAIAKQVDIDGTGTGANVTPKTIAKLSLNSAGKVEKLALIDSLAVTAVNKDQNYVNVAGGSKFADTDTKVIRVDKYGNNDLGLNFVTDAQIGTWDAGESFAFDQLAASKTLTAYYKDSKLKYLFVDSNASMTSDLLPVLVSSKGIAVGDAKWGLTIIEPGKSSATYEVTDVAYDTKVKQDAGINVDGYKTVYLIKLNTEKTKITSILGTDTPVLDKVVTEVTELSSVVEVKYASGTTVINKNAKVFKKTDSGTVEGTISDISSGKTVDFYNTLDKDDKVTQTPLDIIYDFVYVE
ncbi:MAG: S-layer homology domain-containing protein [Carboxydocellales bacterium]